MSTPLTEVMSNTLDELFALDPLELTEKQIETVVEELRRGRELWRAAELAGARKMPKAKADPKAPKVDVALGELEL